MQKYGLMTVGVICFIFAVSFDAAISQVFRINFTVWISYPIAVVAFFAGVYCFVKAFTLADEVEDYIEASYKSKRPR